MQGIKDYGDNGVVPLVNSNEVQPIVDSILDYVDSRFEILEKEGRTQDIFALVEEFGEWGIAEEGDTLEYYTCPTFE